jgi:parvulin-like peptidyl-prolyl isomerase
LRETISILLAGVALVSVLVLNGCTNSAGGDSASDDIAASVNGVAIPVSKVDQSIDRTMKSTGAEGQALTPVALAAARLQALEALIQEEALFQRAQKDGTVPTDDELRQEIQAQKQRSGMTEEQFQAQLKQAGQTEEEFRTDARRLLAIQRLRDKVALKVPTPTDAEIKKYFDENKAQLIAPRGIEFSDIVVDPANNGARDDAIGADQAGKKVQEIVASLKAGADFATVARARSEDRSALQGGSIGFMSEQQLQASGFPAQVVALLFSKKVGEITEPIQGSDNRYHIFKVNGKREETRELSFEEVRQQISQTITEQRKQVLLSALLIDVMSTANIKNHLAGRIIEHPDTFGALRPSPLTTARPPEKKPGEGAAEATPSAPITNAQQNPTGK